MKLGVGVYTYMWSIGMNGAWPDRPMTALDLLQKAHALGIRVVQMGPNLPLLKLPTQELDRVIKQARDWNIQLDLCTRGLETDHLTLQIALAQRIGAHLLRTIAEVAGQPPASHAIPGYVQAVLPQLRDAGINLGLENNGCHSADELRWVMDEVRDPHLGIVLDTINSLAVPEGFRYTTSVLAPYTMCLHIKDFKITRLWSMMGYTCTGTPAGQGQTDIPWILDAVKAAHYDPDVVIELWPPELENMAERVAVEQAWAEQSVAYMRQFIKE
jgi:3-oxoisoapionate decarboxylase